MSAIASFIQIPTSALAGIREAAVPKRGLFGGAKDTFHDVLRKNGREAARYEWSGNVLATLLPYLEEQGVDLMKSEHVELSDYISEKRQATCYILTAAEKRFLPQLRRELFSEAVLRDYFNEFNGTEELNIGEAMIDGIRAFHESLQSLDGRSVIVLIIG